MAGDGRIVDLDRRARTAGYADGLLELFAAAVLLTMALGWLVAPGFVGIAAAFVALYGWKGVERVKARVTYPRIGYYRERAEEPRTSARGMLLVIAGAFLVMILAVWASGGLSDVGEWRRAAPLVSGISLTGGFWYAGERSGLARHRLIAVWSLASGVALWSFGDGSSYAGVVWHLVGMAVPLAVLGAWSLVRFVGSHPVRDDSPDG